MYVYKYLFFSLATNCRFIFLNFVKKKTRDEKILFPPSLCKLVCLLRNFHKGKIFTVYSIFIRNKLFYNFFFRLFNMWKTVIRIIRKLIFERFATVFHRSKPNISDYNHLVIVLQETIFLYPLPFDEKFLLTPSTRKKLAIKNINI